MSCILLFSKRGWGKRVVWVFFSIILYLTYHCTLRRRRDESPFYWEIATRGHIQTPCSSSEDLKFVPLHWLHRSLGYQEKCVCSKKERRNGIICDQKERLRKILVSKSSKTISFFSWSTARLCLPVSLVARHGHVSVLTNKMWEVTSVASRLGLFGPLTHDSHAFSLPAG